MKSRKIIILLVLAAVIGAAAWWSGRAPTGIVITGLVTTDEVIVSPEIAGRLQELNVKEGDLVKRGQLLALIQPREWKADADYFERSERQSAAQVAGAEAGLKFQEAQTTNQIEQAEATLAATEAQVIEAKADLENARLTFTRLEGLHRQGVESAQSFDAARTTRDGAQARVESLNRQVDAARAAVALAKSGGHQIAARRASLDASVQQLAAAAAQKEKSQTRLGYTELHAPIDGVVDVRAALQGEFVNPGQAVVTLINPDNLWIRADVEETYIDRIKLGDKFPVRLPSGLVREGVVFHRGVDSEFATQRDVSRAKRDIKTFEVRLRCDNADRRLAVGMTAYVDVTLKP